MTFYAFDGRLLAEYDGYGNRLREYIYIGAKMVAEYQPASGKYYYYTTDQVNSTRVVTDDMGNVVYSATHDPYGGVQQTWVNAFNPEWKFSGKEQDAESGLYYFGARYYDSTLYRFLSPDPVIPADRALYNPQRWNLYGYCLGNPINYCDPDGMDPYDSNTHFYWTYQWALQVGIPPQLAAIIASANGSVDQSYNSMKFWEKGNRGWHFNEKACDIETICDQTLDPWLFGQYLHVIQDYYSHIRNPYGRYGVHPFYTAYSKIMGAGYDPDHFGTNPWIDCDMEAASIRLLRNYYQRLVTFILWVVSMIVNALASIPVI